MRSALYSLSFKGIEGLGRDTTQREKIYPEKIDPEKIDPTLPGLFLRSDQGPTDNRDVGHKIPPSHRITQNF